MRALVCEAYGAIENLRIKDVPQPGKFRVANGAAEAPAQPNQEA